jgi:parallel beta-helix repeat protein
VRSADAGQCVFEGLTVQRSANNGFLFKPSASGLLESIAIRDSVVARTAKQGIFFVAGPGVSCRQNEIADCIVTETGDTAIEINGTAGVAAANRIARCALSFVNGVGVGLYSGTGGTNRGNLVESCQIYETSTNGVLLSADGGSCNGNVIRHCNISHAGGFAGIQLTSKNSARCDGNLIEECSISESDLWGVLLLNQAGCAGNVLRDNMIQSGTNIGVRVEGATANRIENNHVHGETAFGINSTGIFTTPASSSNLVVRNSAIGHTINFSISANDTFGPLVTGSGQLMTTGAEAHPAANFSQ